MLSLPRWFLCQSARDQPAAGEGLLMICECPTSLRVFQGLVREGNLGRRKIIMGLQISLEKAVAFFDCKILILCEAADFVVLPFFFTSMQCNLGQVKYWKKHMKFYTREN